MKTTESGPIEKKVNILWVGVIERYLLNGDITNLEGQIRNGGVPAEFGDQVADILIGKLKPPTPRTSRTQQRIEKYKQALSILRYLYKEGGVYHEMGFDISSYKMKFLAKHIFPHHTEEEAKNQLYKFIRKHKLPKLKD